MLSRTIKKVIKKSVEKPLNLAGYDLKLIDAKPLRTAVIYEIKKRHKDGKLSLVKIKEIAREKKYKDLLNALKSYQNGNRITWKQLKILSSIMPYIDDNCLYENILNIFDSKIQTINGDNPEKTSFVGIGGGTDTLHSSRKIQLKEHILFEKIYKKDSTALENIKWFTKNIKDNLNHEFVRVPEIYYIKEGNNLAAVYYDFLKIDPIAQNQAIDRIVDLSMYFYNLKLPKITQDNMFIRDYYSSRPHNIISWCAREYNENSMQDVSELILSLEKKITNFKRRFSHGDLFKGNLGKYNYVIDWDECGFNPPGYDIAKGLSFLCLWDNINEFENFLKEKCINAVGKSNFDEFLFSSIYFHFIFYSLNRRGGDNFRFALYDRLLHW